MTYSGTVSNSGNITITNVAVMSNLNGTTPVFTTSAMAPVSSVTFTNIYVVPANCSITRTLTVVGTSICGDGVTNTVSVTCPINTTPLIAISQNCPVIPPIPGGLMTYSGTVSNAGNIMLTNVVVVNNLSGAAPILTAATLAPGSSTNFTGSYVAPTNCSTMSISTATGRSICGIGVTNTASATCPINTTPLIAVSQNCPVIPPIPGGLMTYSGTVSNAGNIMLTNVVVVNNLSGATPIFTAATLAPGSSTNFTGSYVAQTNCSAMSISTATGRSICGISVTNTASATCPINTTPLIAISQNCPVIPPIPGGLMTYSGTVSNAGNIMLTNVIVVNNLSGATPVFTAATLAPGSIGNFTGSYLTPMNCITPSISTATGRSICGIGVTNAASATCPINTTPLIAINQNCPVIPPIPGGLMTYSGTVSNAGNIMLTNVVVVNNMSGITPIFTAATLAPGSVGNFTGSYLAPTNCITPSISTATGRSICGIGVTNTASATCPINTTPLIDISQNCPVIPPIPGGLMTYSGTVSNAGNIMLTNVVVLNNLSGATPIFTAATLAPGSVGNFTGSYLAPTNCITPSISTATGRSICGIGITNTTSATCPINTTPLIAVSQNCPVIPPIPGGLMTYSGTVSNAGNIMLTNVVVLNNLSGATPVFTTPTLAPGAAGNFTGSYVVPTNCSATSISTATGRSICGIGVTNTVSATCPINTTPLIAISQNCPIIPPIPGGLMTYSGTVSNAGNITLNNVMVTNNRSGNTPILSIAAIAPGESTNFTGSYIAPASGPTTSTSTVRGISLCNVPVTNSASSTCPIRTSPGIAITKACPPTPVSAGGTLTFTGTVTNTGDIMLTNVIVINNQPVPNTQVLGPITLAPGSGTNFSGSYAVALDACSTTDILIATGSDSNTGIAVTNSVSAICPIITIPSIAITQNCPPTSVSPGGLLTYSGSIRNAGNITLNNIVVSNNRSGATPILTVASLIPGATANFTGSYIAPASGVSTSTSTVRGTSLCNVSVTNSASSTCPILTAPGIAITKACPPTPVSAGGTLTFTGTVTNTGNIMLTNVIVINNQPVPNTPVLGPITLAPGSGTNFSASYMVALDACSTTDTLIATGSDSNTGVVVTNSVSAICPIVTIPSIAITQNCPPTSVSPGGLLTYSGSISNAGNITLNNIVVSNDRSGTTPILTVASLIPGARANFTGSYIAPASGVSMSTSTVRGTSLCNVSVTNSASSTCPILTAPGIAITKACPPTPVSAGGTLTFTGTVTNTGNIILTNVFVVNNQPVPNTPVLGPITLAPGSGTNFSASYMVALDACSTTDTLIATGSDSNTGIVVTNSVSAICPIVTIPSIAITQNCPPASVSPGGLLTYSGSVRNAGNITLNNIVVSNDRSGATPILTVASLTPGATTNFTGSYIAPASGDSTSTSTVRGTSLCNVSVTNSASSTCPILTAPGIAITKACPPVPVSAGGTLTFTGTVTNTGNIILTNVFVVNNQPVPNTPVLGPITLAPGSGTNFSASYMVALDACSTTDTLIATGNDSNTGIAVTNSVSAICPIVTIPSIAITQNCPPTSVSPGGLLTYSGSIRNAGNITLNNIVVSNDRSGATPILTVASLIPGASTNFTGSYIAPASGVSMSTSTVRGTSLCNVSVTNSASSTCPILTAPGIAITKACPPLPVAAGGILTFTGTVTNTGNIILTNVFVVNNQPVPNTPVLGPITLAPGSGTNFSASYTVALDACSTTDTLIATGNDSNTGIAVTNSVSAICPIVTVPSIAITQNCPPTSVSPGGLLTYSGSIRNAGNITLNNIVVSNDRSGATPILTVASLTPGATANFTGSYIAPASGVSMSTSTVRGTSLCNVSVTNSASSTCPILTAPGIAITKACPPTPVSAGGTLTFTGTVTNTGNIILTNVFVVNNQTIPNTPVLGPITLSPGSGTNFSASYLIALDACSTTDTLIATGNDSNTGIAVTNSVSATCPIITIPSIAITQNCPPTSVSPGGLLTYSGSIRNAGNITLNNIVVSNDRSGVTPILTVASLIPGASTNFTGSYTAPASGVSMSTSTVRGTSLCNVSVTNSASSTCPILTAPGIAITKVCPPLPVAAGGILTFTGTVTNTGNIILTNVFVVNSLPIPNTAVLGPITLAPGSGTNFTGSYIAPLNVCSITDTLMASGNDSNTGIAVNNSAVATCPILTLPGITITQICPPTSVSPGGLLTYSGTVSNSGNITLNNVVVTNSQSGNTPILSVALLIPGASANFTGSYIAPATGPTTSTSTARAMSLCGAPVLNTASSTCPILTTPGIAVTKLCPPLPVAPGGTLVFTGTITNAGNVTLTNVFVVNSQPVMNTPVLGPITLAPGSGTNFTGSYIVPLNVCVSADILTVTGNDASTGIAITNTASALCTLNTTPLIAITQNCPASPVSPGSLLTYSGIVSNAGNITLNNVVVTNSQSGNTPIISVAMMIPGASASFTGSYIAPATGPTTSTSTARGTSLCGVAVQNTASSTCPIVTAPGIAVTKLCPPVPVGPGGTLVFTGTVTNTGNVTLTNIVIVNSQPVLNTPVLGPISLAPGSGTNFTGSYIAPLNTCSVADTLTVTGNDANSGVALTNAVSAICTLITTPGITITESCPSGTVSPGDTVAFTGVVSNTGNITLTNIFVFSGQPTNGTPMLGPITLAPGASLPFSGSYIALGGSNPATNSTIVTNSTSTITTNAVNVITTNNTVTITTNPPTPTSFTTIDSISKAIVDRFIVNGNFNGLTYAGEDHGYGATELYTMRKDTSGTSFFDTIVASTSTTADRFNASNRSFDALAYAAGDLGYGPLLFYYLSHDTAGLSTFGSITPGGAVGVISDHFVAGNNFDALTFTATDLGYGANLFYYVRHDAAGLSTFGTINPALPGTITDRFTVGNNVDALVFTDLTAPGYGPNNFYYLRHDANGASTFGTIFVTGPATAAVTDRFVVGNNASELTFTATDVGFGANLFYILRGGGLNLTTNIVTTFATNTVTTFTTNTVTLYTTNSIISLTPTNTVIATGIDICQALTVVAAANCLGPVAMAAALGQSVPMVQSQVSALFSPTMFKGSFRLTFPTESGKWYVVQYKNTWSDRVWTDLENVLGTGGNMPITDATAAQQPMRFYRVVSKP